jgi:hypothetical protein
MISAGDQIKREWDGRGMWHIWAEESAYRVSVGKPEGKRPLRRPESRKKGTIKMDLQEVIWGGWIGLIWQRIGTGGGSCECGNKPPGSIK